MKKKYIDKKKYIFIITERKLQRKFSVNGNKIPTIHLLINIFGRTQENSYKWIDKCDLMNKDKIWCIYFGLIPKLACPMLIYEVSLTKVETMEQLISKFMKKWLGVPNSLTNVALYSSSTKLPMLSLVEEYKLGKVWRFQM